MRRLEASLVGYAATMAAAAVMPTLALELAALFATGFFSFAYITMVSTGVQVNVSPDHRGRVLALWSMAFLGTTMIGAPIIGWVSNAWGPRAGLLAGAASCLLAAGIAFADRERDPGLESRLDERLDEGRDPGREGARPAVTAVTPGD
jgi:MFS family permease